MAVEKKKVNILRALSGQENIYTIPKLYVRLTKCHARALILNQIIFYSDKSTRNKDDWFDKQYAEWTEETQIPERTLRRIFKFLSDNGWCETKVGIVNGKNTLLCRPLFDKILDDIDLLIKEDIPGQNGRRVRTKWPEGADKMADSSITDKYTDEYTDHSCTNEQKQELSTYQETYYKTNEELAQHISEQNESDSSFNLFWDLYPKKKAEMRARAAWFSGQCYKEADLIMERLREQVKHDREFRDGFAPNPDKYLHEKRWNDQISQAKKPVFSELDQNSDWHKEFHKDRF